MTEKSKKRLNVILLSLLVSLIFASLLYNSVKPVIKDILSIETEYVGYKNIMQIRASDPDKNDIVKFKIVSVFPEHDIQIDSLTGLVKINLENLKYDTYKFWVLIYDKHGLGTTRSYIIKDIKKL